MQERERPTVAGVGGVLLLTWLGFFVHRSPRFPGGAVGSAFGVAGAILMLLPLAYTIAKRVPALRARITRRVSMHAMLAVHVYAGIAGALFAIIHTGHKFDSSLGIALTATTLLVVSSGVAVRYLLPYVTHEIAEKVSLLQTARGDLDHAWGMLELSSVETQGLPRARTLATALASVGLGRPIAGAARDVVLLAEGVADLEYAVRTHELLKRWFHRMLAAHILLSVAFYLLLGAHVWSALYFGIRWLG
jgi:hypothetical protein